MRAMCGKCIASSDEYGEPYKDNDASLTKAWMLKFPLLNAKLWQ
jgi:hypothetical protein